jgi:preprotein translocase subunit SecG
MRRIINILIALFFIPSITLADNYFLEKATWTLATVLLVMCILASLSVPRNVEVQESIIEDRVDDIIDPNALPSFPNEIPDSPLPEE